MRVSFIGIAVVFFLVYQLNSFALPAGLVSHWRGDNNVLDSGEGGNDGILRGDVGFTGDGKVNGAFDFLGNNANDYVDLGNPENLAGLQQGTVAMWVNVESSATHKQAVLGLGGDNQNQGLILMLEPDSSDSVFQMKLFTENSSGSNKNSLLADNSFSGDVWHHLAWVSDGSQYQMYLDGVAQSLSIERGRNDGEWLGNIVTSDSVGSVLSLGSRKFEGNFKFPFQGALDEVMVFDRNLSPTEIQSVMEETTAIPEPGTYWLSLLGMSFLLLLARGKTHGGKIESEKKL